MIVFSFHLSPFFLALVCWWCCLLLTTLSTATTAATPTCYGIMATELSNVCSGHGFCIADDTCVCHDNYELPSCATRSKGFAYAAGSNLYNQLGEPYNEKIQAVHQLTRVGDYFGLMNVEAISSGHLFSLGLNNKGEVFGWGANNYGQLGRGFTSSYEAIPTILRGDLEGKRIVSIAACYYHGLAADSEGKVYAWGTNREIINVVTQEDPMITGGWLGIEFREGTGFHEQLQPTLVPGFAEADQVVKVICGKYHSLALTAAKKMKSWGGNLNGQLGYGQIADGVHEPTQISLALSDVIVSWVDVVPGEVHSVALDDTGRCFAWGATDQGQSGVDKIQYQTTPILVPLRGSAISIGASKQSSFAVFANGTAYSWGSNNQGELGSTLVSVGGKTHIPVHINIVDQPSKYIYSGPFSRSVFSRTTTEKLLAWGDNGSGQYGTGSTKREAMNSTLTGLPFADMSKVHSGANHALFLFDALSCFSIFSVDPLVCSGHGNCTSHNHCECQEGYTGSDCSLPICHGTDAGQSTVCSGNGQCLTIDTCLCFQGYSGQNCEVQDRAYLYGSGDNSYGQLADNLGRSGVNRLIPVQARVFKGLEVNLVASGTSYSLILLTNGSLFSVGLNDYGQLGDGTRVNRGSPVLIGAGLFKGMCAGYRHSLAVDLSGAVWAFGDNSVGQLGIGSTPVVQPNPTKVQGALFNEDVVSVACGTYHSMALIRNGTVLVWGNNTDGQLGDETFLQRSRPQTVHLTGLLYKRRASAMAAGGDSSFVIADSGTLYRWGDNWRRQLGDASFNYTSRPFALKGSFANKRITSIAANSHSSYFIADDQPYSAGANDNGQLGLGTSGSVAVANFTRISSPLVNNATRVFSGTCGPNEQRNSVGMLSDSKILVWGANAAGQLGDGTYNNGNSPLKYHIYYPERRAISVSIGCYHALILYDISRTCSGVLSDEPSVCSYHGNCTDVDQCSCETGYTGDNCQHFQCGGIDSTSLSVCSGRGKCIGIDSCVCDPGFSGKNCEQAIRGITYAVGRHQTAYGELGNDDVPSAGLSTNLLLVQGLLTRVIVTKVNGGLSFSAALASNGDLYTWGSNNYGQLGNGGTLAKDRPFRVLTQVIDFCVGSSRVTAIKKDSSVWAWGRFVALDGVLSTPTKIIGFELGEKPKSVGCGTYHSLVLTDAGTVYAFGHGGDSALGVGSISNSWTALKVLGLDDIVQVSGGDRHSLALGSFGQVFAWGKNNQGQLGDTTTTSKNVPVLVTGATTSKVVVKVSGSMESSFALTHEGEIYSWGGNRYFILGDASIVAGASGRKLPGLVKGIDGIFIKDIYSSKPDGLSWASPNPAGWATAINATGAGYSWGYNTYSNLGDKTTTNRTQPTPQTINAYFPTTTVVSVGAAHEHSLILLNGTICYGILADDPLVCSWRGNCIDENTCQCDDGYFGNECELTQCFGVNSNDSSVCSGKGTCIAFNTCTCTNQLYSGDNCELAMMGYLFGTGANNYGQLGDDLTYDRSVLVMTSRPLSTEKYVKLISAGHEFSLAISLDGELYSWGYNIDYTLGIGSKASQVRPQLLFKDPPNKFISASAAMYHAAAVDTSGRVYTWGANTENGDTDYDYRHYYSCGYSTCSQVRTHECSEKSCCTPSDYDCINYPTKMGMLGLGSDYFYSSTPRQVSGISGTAISVSCGVYHCLVLTSSGELWSWGDNTYGQLGDGAYGASRIQYSPVRVAYDKSIGGTLSDVKIIAISAGSYHSMALSSLGELFVWGSNTKGQIGDGIVRSSNLCRFPKKIIKPPMYRIPFKTLSAGTSSTHALSFSGSLFSWGSNSKGQLGINSTVTTARSTPVPVNDPLFSVLSASKFVDQEEFVLSADLNGDGYSWGSGTKNKLVTGLTTTVVAPTSIRKLYANPVVTQTFSNRTVVAVAAGTLHSLLLLNGTYCFGLFSDDPYVCSSRGQCIATDVCQCDTQYFGYDCGQTTCFDVASNSSFVCSGNGFCTSYDSCSCSIGYTGYDCSVYLFGETYSVGSNTDGQLGDDYYLNQTNPVRTSFPLSYGEHVKFVSAGIDFSVAISRNNKLYVWGKNAYYNLGTGSQTKSLRPFNLLPDHEIVSACAGKYHGVAVNSSGAVFSWGANTQDGILTCTHDSAQLCSEQLCTCQFIDSYGDRYYYPPSIQGQLGLSGQYFFSNTPRQVNIPLSEKVVSVSCGLMHTVARTEAGKLFAWGDGSKGQIGYGDWNDQTTPVQVATSSPVREILSRIKIVQHASGHYHNIALGSKGDVYTWGDNSKGQLGHGSSWNNRHSRHPIRVYDLNSLSIVQVAAGDFSSYALASDGTVFAWGDNSQGQLGINDTVAFVSAPRPVEGLNSIPIISIAVGFGTSMAISSQGKAYSWGMNSNYQAIDGSKTNKFIPTEVINPEPTRKIVGAATGNVFSVILLNTTYCYGIPRDDVMACSTRGNCTDTDACYCNDHYFGLECEFTTCYELNNNDSNVCSGHGICVAHDTCQCSVGFSGQYCEHEVFGSLRTIGNNDRGQLGDDYTTSRTQLVKVYEPLGDGVIVSQIASGVDSSFAITRSGNLYSWGRGDRYELGYGITNQLFPRQIMLPELVISVCTGTYHSVAITRSGSVYSWGVNTVNGVTTGTVSGQLGLGSGIKYSRDPTIIPNIVGTPIVVACGERHTLVLTKEGSIYGFGDDTTTYGAVGYGLVRYEYVPVRVGASSPIRGLLSDVKIVSIAAGQHHSMALGSQGEVYTWGWNNKGQLGDNTTINNRHPRRVMTNLFGKHVVRIAASSTSSYAVTSDGELYAWGENDVGQLGINSQVNQLAPTLVTMVSDVEMVSAGTWSKYALITIRNGTAFGFGDNTNSKIGDGTSVTPRLSPSAIVNPYNSSVFITVEASSTHSMFLFNGTFCFGILADDKNVCSGRGVCVSNDDCRCEEGYFGVDCSINSCFGLNQSHPEVCSGHGYCVARDACACETYFSGHECEKALFGQVFAVGENSRGQLGDDHYNTSLIPIQTAYPLSHQQYVRHVVSGLDVSFALTDEGELYSWGKGLQWSFSNKTTESLVGLLGDGSLVDRNRPIRILESYSSIVHICAGYSHVAVVTDQNEILTWGINTYGQNLSCLNVSTPVSVTYPVQETFCICRTNCPTKSDVLGNSTYYWTNTPVLVTPPSDNYLGDKVVELACGAEHTLARTSNGMVYGWGSNRKNQLGLASDYGSEVHSPVRLQAKTANGELLSNKRVISIAAGELYSLALTDRGKVYAWGNNDRGQIADGSTSSSNTYHGRLIKGQLETRSVTRVAGGKEAVYVIDERDLAFSWGSNLDGQLGIDSDIDIATVPTLLSKISNVTTVSSTIWTNVAHMTTHFGTSFACGNNSAKHIGLMESSTRIVQPTATYRIVDQLRFVVVASIGVSHSLFLYNGTYCSGVLADDPSVCAYRGICIDSDLCVCDSAYDGMNCTVAQCFGKWGTDPLACSGNGKCLFANHCECHAGYHGDECNDENMHFVYSSGNDSSSQLGDGFFVSQNYPRQASLISTNNIKFISAGLDSSFALSLTDGVFAFGNNDFGQLGDNTTYTRYFPVQIFEDHPLFKIISCHGYSFAIDKNYQVYSWGRNEFGQLGTNDTNPLHFPTDITHYFGLEVVIDMACGTAHSLAVTSSGRVFSWGKNKNGELGRLTFGNFSPIPAMIEGLLNIKRVIKVAAGGSHSLALNEDGSIYAWGSNSVGQLGDGMSGVAFNRVRPYPIHSDHLFGREPAISVVAGIDSSFALLKNGSLLTWGYNLMQQVLQPQPKFVPLPLGAEHKIVSMSIGTNSNFAIALASNGTAWGWGENSDGQLGDYTFTSRNYPAPVGNTKPQRYITGVSLGQTHSLFLYSGISCFGIPFDDPTVCSWRGNCTALNHCVCPPSYGGRDCSVSQCYGINATDTNVCSGNGRCVALDICVCLQGYSGTQCEVASYGYLYASGRDDYSQLGSRGRSYRPIVEKASLFSSRLVNLIVPAYQYSLLKTVDGSVYSWGRNDFGQLGDNTQFSNGLAQQILAGYKIVGLCGGINHGMALEANGSVLAWGSNLYGQIGINSPELYQLTPTRVTGELLNDDIVSIACGGYHSMALSFNGSVYTWGFNLNGELGDSTFVLKYTPIKVGSLLKNKRMVHIAAGRSHSIALGSDGTVYTWGLNDRGQLGDNTNKNKFLPVQVPGALYGNPVSQISAGAAFTVVISSDGTPYSWGANQAGQLGDGTQIDRNSPTKVSILPNNTRIVTISAGGSFVHALAANKEVYSWGDNFYGQLGDGNYNGTTSTPVLLQKPFESTYPTAALSGDNFSLYLFNGTTCFGKFADDPSVCSTKGNCTADDFCVCPPRYNAPDCSAFHCFGFYPNDQRSCSGHGVCLAADSCSCYPGFIGRDCNQIVNGYAFTIGKGSSGQIGDGYTFSPVDPVPVKGKLHGKVISLVSSGKDFSIAITTEGEVYGWGLNNVGQLGDGTTIDKMLPSHVVGLNSRAVTGCTGMAHTVIVDEDGKVFTWGSNYRGQLGIGDITLADRHTPVRVHGDISDKFIVQSVCGEAHTAVLTDEGIVYAWGLNSFGQIGNGDNWPALDPSRVGLGVLNTPLYKIASGWNHMLGIGEFGTLYVWGSNSFGQLGDGYIFNRYSPTLVLDPALKSKTAIHVQGSEENTYVLFSDGSVFSTGGSSQGQLGINSTSIQGRKTFTEVIERGVISVHAGKNNAFVLKRNETNDQIVALSWGSGSYGQLGNKKYAIAPSPVEVMHNFPSSQLLHVTSYDHTVFLFNGTSCFGFLSDEEHVCYGRGTCISENDCVCQAQFSGMDCSTMFCHGLSNNDPQVCSGNGVCSPNNTCVCNSRFEGTNCNYTRTGFLYGAGDGSSGQLGDETPRTQPNRSIIKAKYFDRLPVQHVVAGRKFSLVLDMADELFAVGTNTMGQLGDDTTNDKITPVLTEFTKQKLTVYDITVGSSSTVIATPSGELYSWGQNLMGQLGLGFTSLSENRPTQIDALNHTQIRAVSCGEDHCLARSIDGYLYSWGNNQKGKLGDGTTQSKELPLRVLSIFELKKVSSFFAGSSHSVATTDDGIVYAWGDNSRCQLGQGHSTAAPFTVPLKITALQSEIVIQVSAGNDYSCALTLSNRVYCWGRGDLGSLGTGKTQDECLPTLVETLTNYTVTKIFCGKGGASFALTNTGRILAWGANAQNGQLGYATSTNQLLPVVIGEHFTKRNATGISAGDSHTLFTYTGMTCFNVLQDDPDVCSGGGECVDRDTCVCKPGFSGRDCEFTSCFGYNMTDTANVCSGRGECRFLNTCICDTNKWSGDQCQYINCFKYLSNDPLACSSKGVCVGPGQCNCSEGYTGNMCQYTICHGRTSNDSLICSGKGVCIQPDVCMCYSSPIPGYTGGNCSYPVCYSRYLDRITGIETIYQAPFTSNDLVLSTSRDCSGHGSCISPANCKCEEGYTDKYCSTPICFGLNATNPASCNYGKNGTCVAANNCTCLTKFDEDGFCVPLSCYGKNLTTDPPSCNSHLGQGNCINVDLCVCTRGYGGKECEQNVCNGVLQANTSHVCHGRGNCSQPDRCVCQSGYNGTDCEYIDCYGRLDIDYSVCSGHGVCGSPHHCVCDDGYVGHECQFPVCYGFLSNDTSNVCSGNGKCTSPDTCECSYGYSGLECFYPSCFDINSTDADVCSSHGSCYKPDKCNCIEGWVSRDCSIPTCYGIWGTNRTVCSRYGSCYEPDVCLCSVGRVGDSCQLNSCFGFNETDPMACNQHGVCVGPNKCSCVENEWIGFDCNTPLCFQIAAHDHNNVCSGRGSCIYPDTCQCDIGRTGSSCEFNTCFGRNETDPMVCSGHGKCRSVDKCQCHDGWRGVDCSEPVCFGVPFDHRDTCSGFGQCVFADTCECITGKTGIMCQLSMCFAINATNEAVCSASGECVDVDTCRCHKGRTGTQCELNICYSRNESDPTVCSGRGKCVSPESCLCDPEMGFTGPNCDIAVCHGVMANDSNVCSGHGRCVDKDECLCDTNYLTEKCSLPVCYGMMANETNVCNGRGICVAADTCLCDSKFTGSDCEIVKSECDESSEFILVTIPEGQHQAISLIDTNCGREAYTFRTLTSYHTLYYEPKRTFLLIREDGLFSANSTSLTLLREMPIRSNNSAVFLWSSNLVIVSMYETITIDIVSMTNGTDFDRTYSMLAYAPLISVNNSRFATFDSENGIVYLIARKIGSANRAAILKITMEGQVTELIEFNSLPTGHDIQALIYVDHSVYLMRGTYLSKVSGDRLTLVSDVIGFFAREKYESDSQIFLNDVAEHLLISIPKGQVTLLRSSYPRDLKHKKFSIIDRWTPVIDSLSPSGVPADSIDSTWISLTGKHLMLDEQSSVVLYDQNSNITIVSKLVDCRLVGLTGDACFKPKIDWPTGRGSIEFTSISIQSVPGSISIPQSATIALAYFQPYIYKVSPTTAKGDDLIKVYGPWFSTKSLIHCHFNWKHQNGSTKIQSSVANSVNERFVECQVPLFDGVDNEAIYISVSMLGRQFASRGSPAFFNYLDTSQFAFYDSFDTDSVQTTFAPVGSQAPSLEWIEFHEATSRSMMRIESSVSNIYPRIMMKSKNILVNQVDQQISAEFLVESEQTGNLLELWKISAIDEHYRVMCAVNVQSNLTKTISLAYQLGNDVHLQVVKECPAFVFNQPFELSLKLVRPEIEMFNTNATLFYEWLSAQNITINGSSYVPDEPWRIDALLKQGATQVCALSVPTNSNELHQFKSMLSTGHIAISQSVLSSPTAQERRITDNAQNKTLDVLLDRIWVRCPYSICNMTEIPKNIYNPTPPPPDQIKQYAKQVVVAISSIAGSLFFLLFLALLIPMTLFIIWRVMAIRKKRSKQAKLDAWKFEFVLDKKVSSLEDDKFDSVARKMYKVRNEDEHKKKGIFAKRLAKSVDIEMEDISSDLDSSTSSAELLSR